MEKTFDMLEFENIYSRHRIQYKIDHTVSAVAFLELNDVVNSHHALNRKFH